MQSAPKLCTNPRHIAVSKSKGVTIDWEDGHQSGYPLEYLRDECPCASCTGSHGTEPQRTSYSVPDPANAFPMFKPKLRMLTVEEVGAYAFKIGWSDGHSAGIYSYDYLRRICPCDTCRQARLEGLL